MIRNTDADRLLDNDVRGVLGDRRKVSISILVKYIYIAILIIIND